MRIDFWTLFISEFCVYSFGCPGPLLLHAGFLFSCGMQDSHCRGFSRCRALALGHVGFSSWLVGWAAVVFRLSCTMGCGIFPDQCWTHISCISRFFTIRPLGTTWLNSILFVYIFSFMLIPHCLGYCSLIVNFEIEKCVPSNFVPLFRTILALQCHLHFPMNFMISLSMSAKNKRQFQTGIFIGITFNL